MQWSVVLELVLQCISMEPPFIVTIGGHDISLVCLPVGAGPSFTCVLGEVVGIVNLRDRVDICFRVVLLLKYDIVKTG